MIKEDLESFEFPDRTNPYNVHCGSGYCVGYTKWGHRDVKHYIVGTSVEVPGKHVYGITKTKRPISRQSFVRIKKEFEDWMKSRDWYFRGIHFEVRDDEHFQRLELRIWIK